MARKLGCGKSFALHQFSSRRFASAVSAACQPLELSLECGLGPESAIEKRLLSHSAFSYAVHPNVSAPSTWKAMLPWSQTDSSSRKVPAIPQHEGVNIVETLPVNLRSQSQLQQFVQEVYHASHPAAMLCVSGSHPVRRLPIVNRSLPSSINLLEIASVLKASGEIDPSVQLWGVGNPVVEQNASRMEQKAAAGADAFLTQPPLDWDNFERWMKDVQSRGLDSRCRILIGIPLLTSAAHLRFWIFLCGAPVQGEAQDLLNQWSTAEVNLSKHEFNAFRFEWNRNLIQQIKGMPGVGGLHAMPFSRLGRKMILQLLDDGTL